ncbi:hypothetical protein G9A89_013960 [Geosiphon pyriformis]|nr:hypothetical protein G9A89_013960 [Geosiphon pyriformis]
MATDGITNQMAGQRKVLVRDIFLGISDREVGAAIKKFDKIKKVQIKVAGKWQSAVVEYSNQSCKPMVNHGFDSEASCNNATKKPLVIGNILVHWVPTDAKEKKEGDTKKVTNNIRLAKLYVRKNVPEENIKAFGGKSYAKMVDKIAKLLSTVAAKLKVTVEKEKDMMVAQQQNHNTERKRKVKSRVPNQNTLIKSNLAEKNKAYNPEREIKEIKKLLKLILKLLKQMMCSTFNSNTEQNHSNNNTWKIGTINVRRLNNPGKAEEVLQWCIEEQFDFVIIMETKLTSSKEKGVFFGSDEYHAFWESSDEKQMGTGVGILVKKGWMHHCAYSWAVHVCFQITYGKQNKEIIIVASNLIEDLTSKSLEETFVTNRVKASSNGVQRRLDYVFTDAVTALLVTNIGVIDVNELFSTDHKAVVTIIQSNRILAGIKKSRSERKKSSTTMVDVREASGVQWEIYAREIN